MSGLVCGRCGMRTAPDSSYCPRCRWALVGTKASLYAASYAGDQDAAGLTLDQFGNTVGSVAASVVLPEVPSGAGGIVARHRVDKQRAILERDIKNIVDPKIEALEKHLEKNPGDAPTLSALGTLHLLQAHYDRAIAYLQRAHEIDPQSRESALNLGIAQAQRGQTQPSLAIFAALLEKQPDDAQVLFNYALAALLARRAALVLQLVDTMEKLWQNSPELEEQYRSDTITARGLALLLLDKPDEARVALQNAAHRHQKGSAPDEFDSAGFSVQNLAPGKAHDDESSTLNASQSADFLNNLAIVEAELGAFDDAQTHLNAAVRIEPGNARVDGNLGVLAYQRGEVGFAYQMLDLARQIEQQASQTEASTHSHLGVVLSSMGRTEDAWREFGLASGHEHADFEVWFNLGRAYIESGKPDRGVGFLRRAFAIEPQNADLHTTLAAGYLMRGDNQKNNLLDEALKHFKRALQLDARNFAALIGLAMTCAELNNSEGALVVLNQAQKLYPRRAEVMFLRALFTLTQEKDPERVARAGTQFGETYNAQPNLLAADYNSALCQYLTGLHETAGTALGKVVQRDPSFTPAYFLIGFGHATANHFDQALTAWGTGIAQDGNNAELHANMGFAFYQRGSWTQSIDSFARANRLLPADADILSCLGLAYGRAAGALRKEREARAAKKSLLPTHNTQRDAEETSRLTDYLSRSVAAFTQSLQFKPGNAITHSNLGLSYYFQNEVEKAVEQWRIVSRLDARYAMQREEEQYRNFDDSQMALRPLRWRELIVGMMPILPPPRTRLVPGYNERAFRPVLAEADLQRLHVLRRQLDHTMRLQSWMNAKR